MSASKNDEKFQNVNEISKLNSRYALYLLSSKKRVCASEKEEAILSSFHNSSESAESSFCLSLLNGNLSPDLETIVRCHLLKSLPPQDSSDVQISDGKYTTLKTSDASEENVGCYYHKLLKNFDSGSLKEDPPESSSKFHTFFLCLIGPSNGVMEPFCSELGTFCKSLLPLLDPEGIKEDGSLLGISKFQLHSWYYYCIEYISRCIRNFNDQLVHALHCSLWGNVKISSSVEETLWDLERFVEVSSLSSCTDNREIKDSDVLKLEVKDKKFLVNRDISFSQYCAKWFEKLKNCYSEDHLGLRGILESFRLKAIQDLNTLKRLIQKAILDHYALFRAYQFLKASGYSDVLLFHVKQEALVAKDNEMIDVIDCLQDYLKSTAS